MSKWKWKIKPEFKGKLDMPSLLEGGTVIKTNPFRTVRRVTMQDGSVYYVKHDIPCTRMGVFKEFFRSKNQAEYDAAELLHRYGIPCVSFAAVGHKFPESVLVSPELKGCVSAAQYRFMQPVTENVLLALCDLLHRMLEHRIMHPDFHAGNLMLKVSDPTEMFLVDLIGVKRTPFHKPMVENCYILTEFQPFIQPGQGPELLKLCGADPALWDTLVELRRNEIESTWPKREMQIRSGDSKFVETRVIDGLVYVVRKSPWYESVPFDPDECEQVRLIADFAMGAWLSQFHCELLLNTDASNKRIVALRRDGRYTVLYHAKDKEYAI